MNLALIFVGGYIFPPSVQNKVFPNATCTDAWQERKYVSGKMP